MKMYKKNIMLSLLLAALIALFAGCQPQVDKKAVAIAKWQTQSSVANLPVAKDLLEKGQTNEAMGLIDKCLAAKKENAQANLMKGKVLYAQGKLTEAENYIHNAVEYDSKLDEGWFWLGAFAAKNDNQAMALSYYNKASNLEPANIEYITAIAEVYASQGKYDKAIEYLEQKSMNMPLNQDIAIVQADLYLRNGDIKTAIKIYKRILVTNGNDPEVIAALGYCYVIDQQWFQASEMFEKLVGDATAQQKETYLQLLAAISVSNSQYGKAVKYFDQLSVSKRDDATVWLKMGQAALGANASRRALACSKRALAIRSGWPDAIALKGCAQYLTGDYFRSIGTFKRIQSDQKLSGFAWLMTGRNLRKMGEHERATLAFKKASRLDPDSELVAFVNR
jgi:tetratricopeptide (TPR) repeat protein